MIARPLSSHQKVPFVCFGCRLCVKHPPLPLRPQKTGGQAPSNTASPPTCPQCGLPLAYPGRYFKVPPRNGLKQWRKAELLWRSGWRADGYSPIPSPQTRRTPLNWTKQSKARR